MKFDEPMNQERPKEDLLFSKEWQIIPNAITLPKGDISLLQKKLAEYKQRINSPESSSLMAADARFKVAILEPLITVGVVFPRKIAQELDIHDPMSEAGHLLLNACEVVQNYIENKEEDNFEGTGLPEKTEQDSPVAEKKVATDIELARFLIKHLDQPCEDLEGNNVRNVYLREAKKVLPTIVDVEARKLLEESIERYSS